LEDTLAWLLNNQYREFKARVAGDLFLGNRGTWPKLLRVQDVK
jgi:hypothetical protein